MLYLLTSLLCLSAVIASKQNDLCHDEKLDYYKDLFSATEISLPLSTASLELPPPQNITGTNCTYQIGHGAVYTISGSNCSEIPLNITLDQTDLRIQYTSLTTIKTNSFSKWGHLMQLHINNNQNLKVLETKAFLNLSMLYNLTITSNPQLEIFEDGCFSGLHNLSQLSLIGNKIHQISQIASVLNSVDLPNITYLDLRENNIPIIRQKEFEPMENSNLRGLILSSTQTEYIHEKAFNPLRNLDKIIFTQNKINGSVAAALINNLKIKDNKLNKVSLAANPLFNDQEPLLKAAANSTIAYLDISNTYFLELNPGFFPNMPNLQAIDISNILLNSFPENLINETLMPNLCQLHMSKNNLRGLTPSMALRTITHLDLSDINFNNLAWNVNFFIDSTAFKKMPRLKWLTFKGTRLNAVNSSVFSHATNLEYLSLRDSALSTIEDGSFKNNTKLQYLDLSRNLFTIFKPLSKDLFLGLERLLALDLSYCHINNFPNNDVFKYLKSLKYLSLRMNSLYNIDGSLFSKVPRLNSLDLRYNTIVSWNHPIFPNNYHLKNIFLSFNHLSTITPSMLKDFSRASSVSLQGNSIVCDCALVNAVLNNANSGSNNKTFSSLPFNSSTDTCYESPQKMIVGYLASTAYSYVCVEEKWPVTVVAFCIVLIVMLPSFYFLYRNYKLSIEFAYLTIKERMGLIKFRGRNVPMENLDGTVKDAFVSYSCEDESFVEKMVYILESEGFDLLLYKRDFNAGDIIPDKILESIESSRKTILVLSESFAKSEWCLWEMYIAQNRSIALIKSEQEPLLLIKKSEIDESLMTPTLKHLMKTRVYLQWHDSPLRQNIFWQQLKLALNKSRAHENKKEVKT